ncbi:hypothetical protein ACIBI9_34250 [Nonomuraea sp. NPDC050451]|uniref:hypothetical protein n=1 Tax=Nonomuraea sp. NPDC050451 TaxID=3364364 RepID=UPI0037B203A6
MVEGLQGDARDPHVAGRRYGDPLTGSVAPTRPAVHVAPDSTARLLAVPALGRGWLLGVVG